MKNRQPKSQRPHGAVDSRDSECPRVVTRGHSPHGLSCHVDWLEFTIACNGTADIKFWLEQLALFLMEQPEVEERGRNGYTWRAMFPCGAAAYWHPERPEMGLHVEFPGNSLAILAERKQADALDIMRWMAEAEAKTTRVDLAMDTDQVDMGQIIQEARAGHLVSRATSITLVESLGGSTGATLYIGSRKAGSRKLIRIYDKAAEQGQGEEDTWTRFEAQLRREYAEQAARLLLEPGEATLGEVVIGIISASIDWRENDNDKVERRTRRAWWQRIIDGARKIRLTARKAQSDLEATWQWLKRQVAPSLATVLYAAGGEMDRLILLLNIGTERMAPRHYRLAAQAMAAT